MASFTGDDTANTYVGLKSEINDFDTKGGADRVEGGYLYDIIDLGAGDDTASGNDGADRIITGAGNDTVSGGEGDDTIISNGGAASDDKILEGDTGDDIFALGAGGEYVSGGLGEDWITYYGSPDGVRVDLTSGKGSGGYAKGDTYSFIEHVAGSTVNDRIIGNGAYNWLFGYGGQDTIRGGAGGDSLDGGDDSDTLDYRTSDAGVRIDLARGTAFGGDAQGDSFVSFENVDGSDFGDRLTGNTLANRLRGFDGKDQLVGGAGADMLSGGGGADRLTGGSGADELRGGSAADTFVFRSTRESGAGASARDEILDFRHGQHDRIDLSAIDANSGASGNQEFDFIGTARFHGISGELRVSDRGSDLLVTADINGDKQADFSILLADLNGMQSNDFLL